jgi:hypothetical protein
MIPRIFQAIEYARYFLARYVHKIICDYKIDMLDSYHIYCKIRKRESTT